MSIADDLFESIKTSVARHGFRVVKRHGEKHGDHWTWVYVLTDEPGEPPPPPLGVAVVDRVEAADKVR